MVFEEAIFIKGSNRKKYSVEEVTQLRNHDLKTYASVKDYLFCPECEKPHLTHNLCTTKSDYFSTYNKEEHDAECSIKCKKAASRQLELLQNGDKALDRLQNRLKAVIVAAFSDKKPKHNPYIIKIDSTQTNNSDTSNDSGKTANYALQKKRLTNGLSENDINTLKIFYGYVRLRCKRHKNGYKLYVFSTFDKQLPMICSIYLSQKVYDHMDISESECFNCYLAFFAQMEMNIQNDKTYYNCILTDSRKMFWMKTDR